MPKKTLNPLPSKHSTPTLQGLRIANKWNASETGVGVSISTACYTRVAGTGTVSTGNPPRCDDWEDWRVDDHADASFFRPGSQPLNPQRERVIPF